MRKDITLSDLQTQEAFENPTALKGFLAEQLYGGRLTLVLGAGASQGFGLPDWNMLTEKMAARKGARLPVNLTNEEKSDVLLSENCGNDDIEFAKLVRESLYEGFNASLAALRKNDLMMALGAMAMASSRGSVAKIVSFNFDNLLETFLGYFGFDVEAISQLPYWTSRVDVRVFHPHGFLPQRGDVLNGVVLAKIHYDRVIGAAKSLWRSQLLEIMRSSTCLFIGLSGADDNLTSLLSQVREEHASVFRGDKYWGIRFGRADDPRRTVWDMRGVFHQSVATYEEVPLWLFEVCQIAAYRNVQDRAR